ncbi:hypothetical protein FA10DRAFT_300017 [Acaromyces ingoldii]|uniref:Exoribonuclease phosphorolytic domain-containing protein n=1 Tax=Acaromyces ingoldii TaxID=215250 RepID=A0A316YTP9_9BASI|nr:hypothetical protein FA10DRAFT_300017 [Acaromyces ingoldii]PWN91403.1 hypothetical protein FA10DRAFT_300017 [Acaromyces ingoldii]
MQATIRGRANLQVGPTSLEQGVIAAHDGSALFSFGPTTSLATLSGPMEVRLRDELTDRAALDVNLTPLQGVPGVACTSFGQALHDLFASVVLLHLYPRALLQLNVQTYARPPARLLRGDKLVQETRPDPDRTPGLAERAAHINAASLALLDARTPMRATVVAICACYVPRGTRRLLDRSAWRPDSAATNPSQGLKTDGTMMDVDGDVAQELGQEQEQEQELDGDKDLVLDPSPAEEALSRSGFLFAFAISGAKPLNGDEGGAGSADVVLSQSSGRFSLKEHTAAMKVCRQASRQLMAKFRESIQTV